MPQCDPTNGGCWFCSTDDGEMYFSVEFDTWFHMDCLVKELGLPNSVNPEAEIIAREHVENLPVKKA
jgi:hypothetical protein